MSYWLGETLNIFLAKLGLPEQVWQQSPHLSLQFDNDITCEISLLDETLLVCFLIPVALVNQTQVLNYLLQKNNMQHQLNYQFHYHWFNNQAVVQHSLSHSEVTEIALEQALSSLLNESQMIKAM